MYEGGKTINQRKGWELHEYQAANKGYVLRTVMHRIEYAYELIKSTNTCVTVANYTNEKTKTQNIN